MRRLVLTLCVLVASAKLFGQYALTPLNFQQKYLLEEHLQSSKQHYQTAFAPFVMPFDLLDSIADADTENWQRKEFESWVMRKVRNEHLFEVREDNFRLNGDAVFNFEAAKQVDDQGRRMFTNSRGFQFTGTLGKRFFFGTSFYETQSIFPNYMDSVVFSRGDFNTEVDPERGSVPGYGRWKPFNTSDSYDYDYTLGTGYVGLVIGRHSFIQFGHDKQFLGYGYRSLLLSDASAPYPFLRMNFSWFNDRLTYTTTWAVLQSLERVAPVNYNSKEAMFRRLGGRFSYLHFEPFDWVGLGLFDGTTWRWRDNDHPASVEYYMPYGLAYTGNGIQNHIVGLNGYINPLRTLQFYGQVGRNLGAKSPALQLGMKWQGLPENLTFVLEYNRVGTSFYYTGNGTNRTRFILEPFEPGTTYDEYYQHNDQSLGHPWMISMNEYIVRLNYRLRDVFIQASYQFIEKYPPVLGGWNVSLITTELGYVINPRSNAQLVFGNIMRRETGAVQTPTSFGPDVVENYTYIALRTSLLNRYLDF